LTGWKDSLKKYTTTSDDRRAVRFFFIAADKYVVRVSKACFRPLLSDSLQTETGYIFEMKIVPGCAQWK
jgi:hypothetical protein